MAGRLPQCNEVKMPAYRGDWNIPDDYPPPNCSDQLWLAWEFLRRNEAYALHVEQMLALDEGEYERRPRSTSATCLDGLDCWPPALRGETARQYHQRMQAQGEKGQIIRPKLTFINRWALEQPVPVSQTYDPAVIRFVQHDVGLKCNATLLGRQYKLVLHANEAAIRFRLDMPLEPQLEAAKKRLQAAANEFDRTLDAPDGAQPSSMKAIVSLRNSREGRVLEDAHYWLRSYDAMTAPKELIGDPERRRALVSGEAALCDTFTRERGHNAPVQRGVPSGWRDAAKRYINGKQYLKLLYPLPQQLASEPEGEHQSMNTIAAALGPSRRH